MLSDDDGTFETGLVVWRLLSAPTPMHSDRTARKWSISSEKVVYFLCLPVRARSSMCLRIDAPIDAMRRTHVHRKKNDDIRSPDSFGIGHSLEMSRNRAHFDKQEAGSTPSSSFSYSDALNPRSWKCRRVEKQSEKPEAHRRSMLPPSYYRNQYGRDAEITIHAQTPDAHHRNGCAACHRICLKH